MSVATDRGAPNRPAALQRHSDVAVLSPAARLAVDSLRLLQDAGANRRGRRATEETEFLNANGRPKSTMSFAVRDATEADLPGIMALVVELAVFEKMPDAVSGSAVTDARAFRIAMTRASSVVRAASLRDYEENFRNNLFQARSEPARRQRHATNAANRRRPLCLVRR